MKLETFYDRTNLINRTTEPALYLEIGDRTPGDEVHYPDVDLFLASDFTFTANPEAPGVLHWGLADRVGASAAFDAFYISQGLPGSQWTERLLAGARCHVNLIPLNPVDGIEYRRPPMARVRAFASAVRSAGLPVTVRIERGGEIQAACGQLRLAAGLGRPSRWTPAAQGAQGASPAGARSS